MKKVLVYATVITLILGLVATLVCLGLSAWDMTKTSWVKNELARRALIELKEKQNAARIKLADEAITILESKVLSVQEGGASSFCQLVLSTGFNNRNLSPDVLRYKLSLCTGHPYNDDAKIVFDDAARGIIAITPLEYVIKQNPGVSKSEQISLYERERRGLDSLAVKEAYGICKELRDRLQKIEDMTPSIPPPAEKPASK